MNTLATSASDTALLCCWCCVCSTLIAFWSCAPFHEDVVSTPILRVRLNIARLVIVVAVAVVVDIVVVVVVVVVAVVVIVVAVVVFVVAVND